MSRSLFDNKSPQKARDLENMPYRNPRSITSRESADEALQNLATMKELFCMASAG